MTQAQNLATLSQAFTAGALGFRNLLINATGRVNQRAYASGAATVAANQYTLDRWRVVVSGQSLSYALTGNAYTMTAPAGGMEQVVEGINIAGGKYCLSWTGTATAQINGNPVSNGGSVTLPANTDATVRFIGGTVLQPQLEVGTIPTVFDLRPQWIEDLAARRYYEAFTALALFACNATTQVIGGGSRFVPKRATPVVTPQTTVALQPGGITVTLTTAGVTTDSFTLAGTGAGLTVGVAYSAGLINCSSSAEL